eukprot:154192_1
MTMLPVIIITCVYFVLGIICSLSAHFHGTKHRYSSSDSILFYPACLFSCLLVIIHSLHQGATISFIIYLYQTNRDNYFNYALVILICFVFYRGISCLVSIYNYKHNSALYYLIIFVSYFLFDAHFFHSIFFVSLMRTSSHYLNRLIFLEAVLLCPVTAIISMMCLIYLDTDILVWFVLIISSTVTLCNTITDLLVAFHIMDVFGQIFLFILFYIIMGSIPCICLVFAKVAFCIFISYCNNDFNFIFGIISIYSTPISNFTATLALYCLCFNFICMVLITILMYFLTVIPSSIFNTTFALMICSWVLNVFMYCLSAYCLTRTDCVHYINTSVHKNDGLSLNDGTRREYQFFTHMCSHAEILADRAISRYLFYEKQESRRDRRKDCKSLFLTSDINHNHVYDGMSSISDSCKINHKLIEIDRDRARYYDLCDYEEAQEQQTAVRLYMLVSGYVEYIRHKSSVERGIVDIIVSYTGSRLNICKCTQQIEEQQKEMKGDQMHIFHKVDMNGKELALFVNILAPTAIIFCSSLANYCVYDMDGNNLLHLSIEKFEKIGNYVSGKTNFILLLTDANEFYERLRADPLSSHFDDFDCDTSAGREEDKRCLEFLMNEYEKKCGVNTKVFTHAIGEDRYHVLWEIIFGDVQEIIIANSLAEAGLIDE